MSFAGSARREVPEKSRHEPAVLEVGIAVASERSVTPARIAQLPVFLTLVVSALLACGEADHPPPVGRGGDDGNPTPVIVDFGGTSHAGTGGAATDGMGVDTFAGSRNDSGDASFGGSNSSFGGSDSFGGTDSTFGGTAGDTSSGANANRGGNDGVAGTISTDSFGGTFSTGGL
jgi:hypothetical protein